MSTNHQPHAFYIYFKVFDLNQFSTSKIVQTQNFAQFSTRAGAYQEKCNKIVTLFYRLGRVSSE